MRCKSSSLLVTFMSANLADAKSGSPVPSALLRHTDVLCALQWLQIRPVCPSGGSSSSSSASASMSCCGRSLSCCCRYKPQALHSNAEDWGSRRHSGVVVVRQCEHILGDVGEADSPREEEDGLARRRRGAFSSRDEAAKPKAELRR